MPVFLHTFSVAVQMVCIGCMQHVLYSTLCCQKLTVSVFFILHGMVMQCTRSFTPETSSLA